MLSEEDKKLAMDKLQSMAAQFEALMAQLK
jgi:hypothetical protein